MLRAQHSEFPNRAAASGGATTPKGGRSLNRSSTAVSTYLEEKIGSRLGRFAFEPIWNVFDARCLLPSVAADSES